MSSICNDSFKIEQSMLNINIFSSTSEMNMNGCGIYLDKIYFFLEN